MCCCASGANIYGFMYPILWYPLYPKIRTQNCMHIRGSSCSHALSTNSCPYSKYLWIFINFIMHHFCPSFYTVKCLFLHGNLPLLHTFMHSYADYIITVAHKLHEGYMMLGYF
ncbi:hypothetical protein PPRFG01_0019000 [Plasmodium sp.]|nr:hypothetical protein PPRFG01_0019000 [Plasmodium sp.]